MNNIANLVAADSSDDDFALPALGNAAASKVVVLPPAATSQLSAHNSNNFACRNNRKDPARASISDSDFDFWNLYYKSST